MHPAVAAERSRAPRRSQRMRTMSGRSRTQCAFERTPIQNLPIARGVTARGAEVLAGLLGGLPELDLLRRSVQSSFRLRRHDTRTSLLALITRIRPRLIVVPLVDAASVPTEPLLTRCRRLFPELPVLVLSAGVPSCRIALLSALRADLRVLVAPTPRELAGAVALALRGTGLARSMDESDSGRSSPPPSRQLRAPRDGRIVASGTVVPLERSESVVLVGMMSGQRITLDDFGRRVWVALETEPTLALLVEELRDGRLRADRLAEDVVRLLARWRSLGVIAWR